MFVPRQDECLGSKYSVFKDLILKVICITFFLLSYMLSYRKLLLISFTTVVTFQEHEETLQL